LQWLQNPSQRNGDNLNKEKINELETGSMKKNQIYIEA
jgi:hypothetical protein